MQKSLYLRKLLSSYDDISNIMSIEERSREIKKLMNLNHGKKQKYKKKKKGSDL